MKRDDYEGKARHIGETVMKRYKELPLYEANFAHRHDYDRYYDGEHLLPEEFLKILTEECYGGVLPC